MMSLALYSDVAHFTCKGAHHLEKHSSSYSTKDYNTGCGQRGADMGLLADPF